MTCTHYQESACLADTITSVCAHVLDTRGRKVDSVRSRHETFPDKESVFPNPSVLFSVVRQSVWMGGCSWFRSSVSSQVCTSGRN